MKSNYFLFLGISMLFGAFGVLVRILVSEAMNKGEFPWGTLTVNLTGSLLIGFLMASQSKAEPSWIILALAVGFLGALTTFSSYSMESVRLMMAGQPALAFSYIAVTQFVCLFFCYIGYVGHKWVH